MPTLMQGCAEEQADKAPVAIAKANVAADAPPEAQGKSLDEQLRGYSYSSIGKRDPFQSYLSQVQTPGVRASQRRMQETEEYELDQYTLTAVVTGTSSPKAMVEDPKQQGHVVQIGTRLGKNAGVVTRITPESIIVTEEFRAPTGEKVRLPITIKLPHASLEIDSID